MTVKRGPILLPTPINVQTISGPSEKNESLETSA